MQRHEGLTVHRVGEDGIVRIVVVEVEYIQDIEASGSLNVLEDREVLRHVEVEVPVGDRARNLDVDRSGVTAEAVAA